MKVTTPAASDIQIPEDAVLSPDGVRVVYVLRRDDQHGDVIRRDLWLARSDGSGSHAFTHSGDDRNPAWSPDGTQIAFLRCQGGPPQVWVLPADGGEAVQLTSLPLAAGAPVWSPDGLRIAFAGAVDRSLADADVEADRPFAGDHPVESERLGYQADGVGLRGTVRQHLHVIDVSSGEVRQVTDGDWDAGTPTWSPDGTRIAFAAAMEPDADLSFHSHAYLVDAVSSNGEPRRVPGAGDFVSWVGWVLEGDRLLVADNPNGPSGHTRLFAVSLDEEDRVDLTGALDRNVMLGGPGYPGGTPGLTSDRGSLAFCVRDAGCTHVYAVDVTGGRPHRVLGGAARTVAGLSTGDESFTTVLSTATSFGEVVVVNTSTGAETVCTRHGATLGDTTLYPKVPRTFEISDGTTVHGWVIRSAGSTDPQPLLLDIHGGPHNAWNGAADPTHLYQQDLVSRGWTVLIVNSRGSDGYGEQFYRAVCGGWGQDDAKDFLEPVDALVAEGIADPTRLAVAGYSYGGFMTCYLTSHDKRFAAAVAGGAIGDTISVGGTSDLGHFLRAEELSKSVDDTSHSATPTSPYAQVDEVVTPTLLLHGEADLRCPVGQSKLWHAALRERGIPTRLVLYPGASHLFVLGGRPSYRADFHSRIVDWVEQYAGPAGVSGPPRIDASHWQQRLARLAKRHGVPGATLGILRLRRGRPDEMVEAAYGVANIDTGVPVSTDTLFHIGSITKIWTTTIVMQLVDEGKLSLDQPLITVIPDLRLSDPSATELVTARHLLTHTGGIDGDVFTDTGRGDDCLSTYVAQLANVPQNQPLGSTWSYSNTGFTLLGRVIEKLLGTTWNQAIRDRICVPLGLRATATLPEEALLHRAAVGHIVESGEPTRCVTSWQLPRSVGPAGCVTAPVADLLAFARLHITGGLAPDGTRVLGEGAARQMTEKQVDLPDAYATGEAWGLGWNLFWWDGHPLLGHDGSTSGQRAYMRLLPEQDLAVALLINGGHGRDLYEDLFREIFAEVAGLAMPRPLAPPDHPPSADISPYIGTYERSEIRIEVLPRDGTPTLRTTVLAPTEQGKTVHEFELVPLADSGGRFCLRSPGIRTWTPVTFHTIDTGERYVHMGLRSTPKVG